MLAFCIFFHDLSFSEYESSIDNESNLDESPECEPYTVDQIEQILDQSEFNTIFKKFKLLSFIKLAQ